MSSSLNNPTNEELFYEDLGPGFIQVINLPPETTLRNLKLEADDILILQCVSNFPNPRTGMLSTSLGFPRIFVSYLFRMSDTGPDLHFKYLFNPWYPSPEWDGPDLGFRQNFHIQFDERVLAANGNGYPPIVDPAVEDPPPANDAVTDNNPNEEEAVEP
ncbi:hypothetical protein MJO29_003451 [Puccinia striiformis f. sp. tritici]|nr:hypothetical protein MJO29_003451 [Puccinia striiformis f. sp. tritici]